MESNYESIFTKERNDHFRAGGVHSGNYKICKARYNTLLRELEEHPTPSRQESIQKEMQEIALQVEQYYLHSTDEKKEPLMTTEEFRKCTLDDIRTKFCLQYLGKKYQITHQTYVRWFEEAEIENRTSMREVIWKYVHDLWEKAL